MPFVTVHDDNLFYAQSGAQGVPVLFVHGAGSNHLIWGNQLRAVGLSARACALDLPGHGRSTGAGRNTVAAYRDVILGVLDALGIERVVMVGHSMGGAITQTLALSHPDRVAGIALVGTGARLRVLPAILDGILNDFDHTARFVTANCFGATPDPVLLERSETEFRACPATVTHGDYTACNGFDVLARIAEIRAPTLAICGTEDKMTPPEYSDYFVAKIPGARRVLVERAGHSVMIEQPDAVSRALVEFVGQVSNLPK
ncbi:MAG: alpha/beta hydrolase [Chloroflexi bacterium]|nr:alpha/beta hydrolase [Chloroflexota bacterium]